MPICQGLLFSTAATFNTPVSLLRLWVHEVTRVYKDKLVDSVDIDAFDKLLKETLRKFFEELPEDEIMEKPLLFWHFAAGGDDSVYVFLMISFKGG